MFQAPQMSLEMPCVYTAWSPALVLPQGFGHYASTYCLTCTAFLGFWIRGLPSQCILNRGSTLTVFCERSDIRMGFIYGQSIPSTAAYHLDTAACEDRRLVCAQEPDSVCGGGL